MSVVTTRVGDVAVVTLDWPEHRNSLDHDRIIEVVAALEAVSDDAGAIVLTGTGAFCSGGNLGAVAATTVLSAADHERRIATHAQRLVRTIVGAPAPVIAALDGPAIGLGFDLALACDDRLLGPEGSMIQGWGRVGVLPGAGGQLLLDRLNPSLVWRLLADQPRIDGPTAERWGLGQAVPQGTAVDAAVQRATALCALPREAVGIYLAMHRDHRCAGLAGHLRLCAREQGRLLADPALRERITALQGRSTRERPAAPG